MVRIRFRRVGTKHQPTYRIVAADRESPRDGRFLEVLGFYNPRTEPATVHVDERRLFHWMTNGAQPSNAVHTTLKSVGTWERWERFKQGETLEVLVQEAEQSRPQTDPRTRRDDLATTRRRKRQRTGAEGPPAAEAAAVPKAAEPAAKASKAAEPAAAAPIEPAPQAETTQPEAETTQPEAETAPPEAGMAQPEAGAEPAGDEPKTDDGAEA
jgi:small subunit ribosomal protein S16